MARRASIAVAVLAVAVLAASCGRPAAPGPDVWAVVNGHAILREQVERYYRSQFSQAKQPSPEEGLFLKLNILDELIDNELLMEQAQRLGLAATDSEVEQKFAELKAPYSEAEFQRQLKTRGITVDDLKNDLRERVAIQKLINREVVSKISVSEQEIAAAYQRNQSEFNVGEPQYHIAEIVVTPSREGQARNRKGDHSTTPAEAQRKIQMLLERLKAGVDFSELAMDYSEDPMTASAGGDLGFIPETSLDSGDPVLKRAVMALKPGQISGILRSGINFRIIKLLGRLNPGQRSLSDPQVQQTLRQSLRDRKEQLLRAAYIASLREQARITNYLARQILATAGNLPAGEAGASAPAASPGSEPTSPGGTTPATAPPEPHPR